MLKHRILNAESVRTQEYLEKRRDAFPNLKLTDDSNASHIAVYENEKLVGGVSYVRHSKISNDQDLLQYWTITDSRPAVRISRLWLNRDAPAPTLHFILLKLTEEIRTDEFMYGVLSLPLCFARKHMSLVSDAPPSFIPKLPIKECDWEIEAEPSSEGKKLFPIYLRLGATLLGPASGNPLDRSVRIIFGMKASDVKIRKTHRPRLQPQRERIHA